MTTESWCYIGKRNQILLVSAEMTHGQFNSSPVQQNSRHFAHDILLGVFVNGTFRILIKISLKFVPKGPIDDDPALV